MAEPAAASPARSIRRRVSSDRRSEALFLALFLVLSAWALIRDLLLHNEGTVLMAARARLDPDYLPGDVFLHWQAPLRRLSEWLFGVPTLSMEWVEAALLLRTLLFAAFAAGLALVVRRTPVGPLLAAVVLVVFVRHPSFVSAEWITGAVESKVAGYACVLLGLAAALRGLWGVAGFCLGLATSFHLLVGGWGSLALLGALPWSEVRLRSIANLGVAWLVGGMFAIAGVVQVLGAQVAVSPGFDAGHVVVHLRNPHHLVPRWDGAGVLALLPAALGIVVAVATLMRGNDDLRRIARFGLLLMAPFAVGLLAHGLFGEGATPFLRVYPFRGEALFLMLMGFVLTSHIVRALPPRVVRIGTAVGFAAFVVLYCVRAAPGLWGQRLDPLSQDSRALFYAHVTAGTEPDAVILCAPDNGEARQLMQRAVVVTFKGLPADSRGVEEWYERMVALGGGEDLQRTGFAALDEVAEGFRTRADYVDLARRFGCTHAVVPRGRTAGLEVLHADGELAFCRVPE